MPQASFRPARAEDLGFIMRPIHTDTVAESHEGFKLKL